MNPFKEGLAAPLFLLDGTFPYVYNVGTLKQLPAEEKSPRETGASGRGNSPAKKSLRWGIVIGVIGVILTILMAVAIIYFREEVNRLERYGYIGAFLISILGGATIIVPVPMLAVVFALGGAMTSPWQVALLGLSAAFGELIGALTIYMTGQGAGRAISIRASGKLQSAYERLLGMMERRGPLTLFIVASVINPFFYPAALAAGALRFGLKKYIAIVLAGKIIKCMTTVYAGYFGLKGIFRALGMDV